MHTWLSRLISLEALLDCVLAKLSRSNRPLLLWLLASCQAATIVLTWPLWQIHRLPPMLPALALPELNTGLILLITLGGIFLRPVEGLAIHTVVIIYSILIDQT